MRDLKARLRDIVRQHGPPGADPLRLPGRENRAPEAQLGEPDLAHRETALRELTYVPDVHPAGLVAGVAARLGGRGLGSDGSCVAIDRIYDADRSHGRRRIEACVPSHTAPLHLFDPRVAPGAGWSRRVIFFDIETTGLSGGAGTLAFLVGCGWFEDAGFRVRQFFLAGPSGEHAMLNALAEIFQEASLLVTYNGRTFDVPFMETRWAFHRAPSPTHDLPHFDMLATARRLWRRREAADCDRSCSLAALERTVLGVYRSADVPGFDIPSLYFHYLRTGDAAGLDGILEHNRCDLVSLAAIMSHALWLAREGPEACRDPGEQLALGRLYERGDRHEEARRCFESAVRSTDPDIRRQALAHLARRLRRESRHDEAAEAWQRLLEMTSERSGASTTLDRSAIEALAVHHEHRRKNLALARRYAEALARQASGAFRQEVHRRISRLDRKLDRYDGGLKFDSED
jgi:uncharacterized protein YprB with RNaseH-like and TPR domain